MKLKFVFALMFVNTLVLAQQPQTQPTAGTTTSPNQQSISASLGLHAFPGKDPTLQQRQTDEAACYAWSKQDTGFDPISATSHAALTGGYASPKGLGLGATAAGAGGGAALGAIAGDAGKGAAIGAAVGGIRGHLAEKQAQAQAQQQAQAKAQTQNAGIENFKRAFSACMEAKGYTVK
ncbi:MAG TPA: hypothetical protein VG498_08855 [Terriglobales bacterium]|nr:hypothetical protein [Terriglobales bacterium]